ncbi:MAG: glycerophosphodiester phosphodiesterase [Devosia sp.]
MPDPISVERDGHRTWLKWHRGRRTATDPVFTGRRIVEAMALGASVEVDLVIHADHGCAILHNLTLEAETTGGGRVIDTAAADLRQLHLRDNAGQPIADKVMLLEDLCALLSQQHPHPDALLQLDFKEDAAALDACTIANFAGSIGALAANMIVSGGDARAIELLADATPGLRRGYDPCYGESLALLQASGDHARFTADALATDPKADIIYLAYEIVLAADDAGFDIIGAIHAAGKRVDAWTIREITPTTLSQIDRLLALKVDQITTDDPEGLTMALRA